MSENLQAHIDALAAEVERLNQELAHSKQVEDALRKSERRYQSIFEHTAVGLAQVSPDGSFIEANRPFCELLGYSHDELLQKTYTDLNHPDDREAEQLATMQARASEMPSFHREKRCLRKDGSVVWVKFSLSTMPSTEGDRPYMLVAIENISERKTLQDSLQRIANDLAKVDAIAPVGSWKWNLRTNEITGSTELSQIYGLPARKPLPVAAILDRILPEDREKVRAAMLTAVDEQKPYQIEYRVQLPDGTTRLVSSNGEVYRRDAQGKPQVVIGMVQDITQRKDAERALRESERRFQQLFDNAGDGIFIANQDGVYIDVNRNACRMLGYARDELVGKHITDLIASEDVERLRQSKLAFQQDVEHVQVAEWNLKRKDGSFLPTEISARFLPDGRWMAIVRDISERQRMQLQLERHTAEINDLYENAPCGYHSVDRDLVIVRINKTELDWLGYTREELVGKKKIADLQTPKSRITYLKKVKELAEKGELRNLELELVRKDGSVMPALMNSTAIYDEKGDFASSRTTVFDVTKLVQAQKELRRAATVFEHTKDAIVVADGSGTILAVNKAFTEITGYRPEEVLGKNPRLLKSGRQDAAFYEKLWNTLKTSGNWQGEIWDRRKSGDIFPTWQSITAVKDENGRVTDYISVFSDITTIKNTEEQLTQLAYHDTLTGLPNRLLYNDRLDHALQHARRHKRRVGLLLLDLDRFKLINDTLGHSAGDKLLEIVADRLRVSVRGEDTVARLSGDEFAIVMGELTRTEDAAALARKIIDAMSEPLQLGEHTLTTSVSIGISIFPDDAQDKETLCKSGDVALYAAKEKGRNCYEFYTPSMTQRATEVLAINRGLRHAVSHNELVLYYQPQISLATGRIAGIEVLVRWNSPQRGMQSPARFIPVAEESNLIELLGDWVFDRACVQLQEWRQAGIPPVRLALNLSGRQLRQPGFVDAIREKLHAWPPMNGYGIDLEVTETALQTHPDIITALRELKPLGFRVAVDDFGTGYSSLHSLKHLPADILKIDRAFIHGIPGDPDDKAITSAIIAMGHSLGMTIIAEGIETQEQLQFLASEHCDEVQGFLFSPPVSATECEQMLIASSQASLFDVTGAPWGRGSMSTTHPH
ncbi:hypothetical protein GCM10027343_15770 [Noviherbaspirillum agri]